MNITSSKPLTESAILVTDLKSTQQEIDDAVSTLKSQKDEWAALPVSERIALIDAMIRDWASVLEQMVVACARAKGADKNSDITGEEWLLGPYSLMRYLRSLRRALSDIEVHGRPRIPGPIKTRPNGQVTAQVFPQTVYDKVVFTGTTIEVWMQPGVTTKELHATQAWAYSGDDREGKVAFILGAGNISSMGPMDILYKLFVEGQVALFKVHPVNAYLGPFIEEGFKVLIARGFLKVMYGDADIGTYVINHPGIDTIYMVGSDKTFEAIAFGAGSEGKERKARNEPLLSKPITAELGNVSPYIVVPGPWNKRDLAYQADLLVSCLANNVGCNCTTPRVVLQHGGWELRQNFMDEVRKLLTAVPLRTAYYPGAHNRYRQFMEAHKEAEQFGTPTAEELPWTLIADVDHKNTGDICFTSEAFCSVFAETPIDAKSVSEYLDKAVEFCNESLWGTLAATIIVHPSSLKDPETAEAVDRAIANLKYGTISLNYLSSVAYCVALSPWGGFPGHTYSDIQSGNGAAINSLMLANTQKTVVRAPFRIMPTPPWFVTQIKKAGPMFRKLTELDISPSPWKIPGIIATAMKAP